MRVPQPDIIEHFGNADAVPQLPERCLSRKAGIVRCCLNIVIPFWLLSPLFISSRSSPPMQNRLAKILSVPVATMAGNNAQDSTTRWQYAPASAVFLEYIRFRLGDVLC